LFADLHLNVSLHVEGGRPPLDVVNQGFGSDPDIAWLECGIDENPISSEVCSESLSIAGVSSIHSIENFSLQYSVRHAPSTLLYSNWSSVSLLIIFMKYHLRWLGEVSKDGAIEIPGEAADQPISVEAEKDHFGRYSTQERRLLSHEDILVRRLLRKAGTYQVSFAYDVADQVP
jgi:hypothetical protein